MQLFFKIMLIADIVIAAAFVVFAAIKFGRSFYAKKAEQNVATETEPNLSTPIAEDTETEANDEAKEETATEEVATEETAEEETAVTEEAAEELPIGDVEETETKKFDFGNEKGKRRAFAEKMLSLSKEVKAYYTAIDNELRSYRKVSARISAPCESFRVGRKLVAKIVVRGRTLTFYLALDVNEFKNTVYFQKDSSVIKAYEDVPFTVKVKSDRALNNALKLVAALAEKEGLVKNPRYQQVNSVKLLKEKLS